MSMSTTVLLQQINDVDTEARLLAIKRLGMIYDDEKIIDPLLKLLLDNDARIREAVILSLSVQSSSPKIIKPIINALSDEVVDVQLAAIKALSEFRSILATKPLIKILSDPEDEVRAGTVLALGLIEDKNALFPLIDCLEDQNSQVRINALVALSQLGDPRSIDPIIDLIQNETDDIVKQMAILSLGPLGKGDKRIVEPLIQHLSSPNPRFRQYAIVSLGQTKNPEIIKPLLKLLNDEDAYVRRACATALSDVKDPATVKEFIARLDDENAEIRETAARALGKLGDIDAILGLIHALYDTSNAVREEAAKSLGDLEDSAASKSLISVFKKEQDPSVKIAMAIALGRIEGNSPPSTSFVLANPAMRVLSKALSHKELGVRAASAESLAKICINNKKYGKAKNYYRRASDESLTWEFKQPFNLASSLGCEVMDRLSKKHYGGMASIFEAIYDNLATAAKMIGNHTFISKNYWKILEVYDQIFQSKNKGQFVQHFRDLGLKILLLAKKLPEDKQNLLNTSQDRLNEKFQVIDKRGLALSESLVEMENLKPDLFDIGNKILQIEPLELRMDEDQENTINVIEDLSEIPSMGALATMDTTDLLREEENIIQRHVTREVDRKFLLEDIPLTMDTHLFAGKDLSVGLIQFLQGAKRESFIEDDRDLWEKFVRRYYDEEVYRQTRILQFTQESIQFRAKPKIIGYLDDAIYEGCKLIIFPECSMPESYLPKLQQFADRFNIFIIAGVECISDQGHFYNRAYFISPMNENMPYQQKNTRTVMPSSEKNMLEWVENIETTSPPKFSIFESPFGKFIILIGNDIKEYSQFIPFITRERGLDFALFLNNGIENTALSHKYQELATEISKPILYLNTGQFGGTNVYLAKDTQQSPLQSEYSEGIFHWKYAVPEDDMPEFEL
ncbi:hypothetical protein NEF87_002976 [Candidatus Lokiarchaeum ossiferum]|uniref:CN hydrolase domain-containing protein n=1 Tax=Candidatus Lokiarchaeum ossiferum TaxID=2951803 RepID=A0ABY6HT45_9ARCH|nr:hypothetical protein NEF87_002976 [Candidatus Lokiarchaeum sp. B-35]